VEKPTVVANDTTSEANLLTKSAVRRAIRVDQTRKGRKNPISRTGTSPLDARTTRTRATDPPIQATKIPFLPGVTVLLLKLRRGTFPDYSRRPL
jgi:hypothetical protein